MSILLDQLTKRYAGQPVVNRLSLEIPDGQFFVLIGPSGSGKSTVLRMIAGLNTVDQGRVLLHGRDVTHAPPQQRGVGFVFQHYALFRHMSVADNIEFALRVRRVAAPARRRRRDELLELVGLAGLGRRMPAQLSGGQQQRVALARALAHQPEVLLLDEPFGALDAKIRAELRRALRQIQTETRITTIFVTHDQDEAFELADRLGVMNFGRLLEVGPPAELYQRPQTEFVASFLGSGSLLAGHCSAGEVQVGPLRFPLNTQVPAPSVNARAVHVLFRPEDVVLAADAPALEAAPFSHGEVESSTFSGAFERVRVRMPAMPGLQAIAPPVPYGDNSFLIESLRTLEQARQLPLAPGDSVWVGVRRLHALAHPGLSFLILLDGSPASQAALALGGQLARLAHGRVTLLGHGRPPDALASVFQSAREALGSGLAALESRTTPDPPALAAAAEIERQNDDLIVVGWPSASSPGLVERLLEAGARNLLLVPPRARPAPATALVSITSTEHGKDDVLLAGPLLQALGAEATLFSVIPDPTRDPLARERAEHFLADGARTLAALGVTARTVVRAGPVAGAIHQQLSEGGHDLLVLGAPLANRSGRVAMSALLRQTLEAAGQVPVLIVRSRHSADAGPQRTFDGRIVIIEEINP
jgi:sulfate transport system ATP-binding protein